MAANMVEFDMRELVRDIRIIAKRAFNMSDVNMQVAMVVKSFVDDKFEEQGPGWPPLSPKTVDQRRGGGARMLQDTGILVNSISTDSGPEYAEVFTNIHYGTFHIEGTKHMPKRDFFDIDEQQMLDVVTDIILEELAH